MPQSTAQTVNQLTLAFLVDGHRLGVRLPKSEFHSLSSIGVSSWFKADLDLASSLRSKVAPLFFFIFFLGKYFSVGKPKVIPSRRRLVTLSRGALVRKKGSRDQYSALVKKERLAFSLAGLSQGGWPLAYDNKGSLQQLSFMRDLAVFLDRNAAAVHKSSCFITSDLCFLLMIVCPFMSLQPLEIRVCSWFISGKQVGRKLKAASHLPALPRISLIPNFSGLVRRRRLVGSRRRLRQRSLVDFRLLRYVFFRFIGGSLGSPFFVCLQRDLR